LIYRTARDTQRRVGRLFLGAFPIFFGSSKYYYWLARFGGNAAGHVIRGCAPPSTTGDILNSRAIFSSLLGGPWVAVAQNVDDDLTWTCPTNPAPEGFMERFRAVVERG